MFFVFYSFSLFLINGLADDFPDISLKELLLKKKPSVSNSFLRCFSFSKMIFFFFSLNVFTFNWRIIALQYYIDFCHMSA